MKVTAMKYELLAALVTLAVLTVCADAAVTGSGRILGGQPASPMQFPYQVSVRRDRKHVGGGAIISRNFVLTAAQNVVRSVGGSVQTYPAVYYTIRAGSIDRYQGGVMVQVAAIKVHPDYANSVNDIALLQLKQPLIWSASISSVPIASRNVATNDAVAVSGWGFNQPPPGYLETILQWINLSAVSQSACNVGFLGEKAAESLVCFSNGQIADSGICSGDIGSSAVFNGQLVALGAFILERCGGTNPDVFTNVVYYRDWIKANSDI